MNCGNEHCERPITATSLTITLATKETGPSISTVLCSIECGIQLLTKYSAYARVYAEEKILELTTRLEDKKVS